MQHYHQAYQVRMEAIKQTSESVIKDQKDLFVHFWYVLYPPPPLPSHLLPLFFHSKAAGQSRYVLKVCGYNDYMRQKEAQVCA